MKVYVQRDLAIDLQDLSKKYESFKVLEATSLTPPIQNLTATDLENIYAKFIGSDTLLFNIRSPQHINFITKQLIKDFHNSKNLRLSISELLMNSLEHGNLKISSQTKNEMIASGVYYDLLEHLVRTNKYKFIELEYKFTNPRHIIITDQGDGFNYKNYLKYAEQKDSMSYSGRGISIVNEELPKESAEFHYQNNGRQIVIEFNTSI